MAIVKKNNIWAEQHVFHNSWLKYWLLETIHLL